MAPGPGYLWRGSEFTLLITYLSSFRSGVSRCELLLQSSAHTDPAIAGEWILGAGSSAVNASDSHLRMLSKEN